MAEESDWAQAGNAKAGGMAGMDEDGKICSRDHTWMSCASGMGCAAWNSDPVLDLAQIQQFRVMQHEDALSR